MEKIKEINKIFRVLFELVWNNNYDEEDLKSIEGIDPEDMQLLVKALERVRKIEKQTTEGTGEKKKNGWTVGRTPNIPASMDKNKEKDKSEKKGREKE